MENRVRATRVWAKVILLFALTVLILTFLLLNMGAVIEPRVHLVFVKYDRPGLLMVLLLTALAGATAGSLVRAVFKTLRQFREARRDSTTAGLEREVAAMKRATSAENGVAAAR